MAQQTHLVCPYCGGNVIINYKKKGLYKCIVGSHTGLEKDLITQQVFNMKKRIITYNPDGNQES